MRLGTRRPGRKLTSKSALHHHWAASRPYKSTHAHTRQPLTDVLKETNFCILTQHSTKLLQFSTNRDRFILYDFCCSRNFVTFVLPCKTATLLAVRHECISDAKEISANFNMRDDNISLCRETVSFSLWWLSKITSAYLSAQWVQKRASCKAICSSGRGLFAS